MTLRFQWVFN